MTTPDLSGLVPLKWKTWVAAVTAVLAVAVPYILQVVVYLPDPWPAVIGGVIAVLGIFGVYKAPYVPPGAVVVPEAQARPNGIPGATGTVLDGTIKNVVPPGEYRNPWQ